jgi:uncharacterized protein YcbK (DUF882 family)
MHELEKIAKLNSALALIAEVLAAMDAAPADEVPYDEQLTTHFRMSQFTKGAIPTYEQAQNIRELAQNLQELYEEINLPIIINSGLRSPEQNQAAGGATGSQHLFGRAADIRVNGRSPQWVAGVIERLIKEGKMKQGGLSPYNNHTHYDTRGTRARW